MANKSQPTDDFTSKVMAEVRKRPRKIGLWNLVYITPVIVSLLIVLTPLGQRAILHLANKKHVAMLDVQKDLDSLQETAKSMEQFDFDQETNEIFNNATQ